MSKTFQDNRGTLRTSIDQSGLARVCFGHPSHNAFPSTQLFALAETLMDLGSNELVKVILLSSEGSRTFCAGASFDELLSLEDKAGASRFFSGFARVLQAIRTCGRLVIGQVQGKAIGGGVGLIAACDYVFASTHASVRLSELGLHIGPFVIEPAISRKIGLSAFSELALNPQQHQDADWAKKHGLYHELFSDPGELQTEVQAFCLRLCTYSPSALAAIKKMLWKDTEDWDTLLMQRAEISGDLVLQPQARVVLQAFKNKR